MNCIEAAYAPVKVGALTSKDIILWHADGGEMRPIISVVYSKTHREWMVAFERDHQRQVVWLQRDEVVYRRVYAPVIAGGGQ